MSTLYHYTKLDTLSGILRKDGLCFWGSRYDSMNDPTDVTYAKNRLLPQLIDLAKKHNGVYNYEDAYPYIVSFSKKQDDLNMWRFYSAEVAIIVDEEKLHDARIVTDEKDDKKSKNPSLVTLKEVRYASEKGISKAAVKLYDEAPKNENYSITDIFNLEVFPFIKNKAYKMEGEVRLVSCDFDGIQVEHNEESGHKRFIGTEIPQNVKCKGARNGLLLLYKEFLVPKEALCGIVVRTSDPIILND